MKHSSQTGTRSWYDARHPVEAYADAQRVDTPKRIDLSRERRWDDAAAADAYADHEVVGADVLANDRPLTTAEHRALHRAAVQAKLDHDAHIQEIVDRETGQVRGATRVRYQPWLPADMRPTKRWAKR